MIIGIDFDGTVADTNVEKSTWIKRELGLEVKPYLCDRTCCVKAIEEKEYERMSTEVFSEEATSRVLPVSGALQAIEDLRQSNQVVIVTARAGSKLKAAAEWLDRYEQTRGLKYHGTTTDQASKAEVCVREGAQVLVDDDERHVAPAPSFGIQGILFKNSAPISLERKGLKICRSWNEILDLLRFMENRAGGERPMYM